MKKIAKIFEVIFLFSVITLSPLNACIIDFYFSPYMMCDPHYSWFILAAIMFLPSTLSVILLQFSGRNGKYLKLFSIIIYLLGMSLSTYVAGISIISSTLYSVIILTLFFNFTRNFENAIQS